MDMQQYVNNQKTKPERLEARISADLKKRLQFAADLQGSTLSEFLLRSAEKAANEIIQEHHIIKFTTEDSRAFADSIFNAPKPNSRLRSAFQDYKKDVTSQ